MSAETTEKNSGNRVRNQRLGLALAALMSTGACAWGFANIGEGAKARDQIVERLPSCDRVDMTYQKLESEAILLWNSDFSLERMMSEPISRSILNCYRSARSEIIAIGVEGATGGDLAKGFVFLFGGVGVAASLMSLGETFHRRRTQEIPTR